MLANMFSDIPWKYMSKLSCFYLDYHRFKIHSNSAGTRNWIIHFPQIWFYRNLVLQFQVTWSLNVQVLITLPHAVLQFNYFQTLHTLYLNCLNKYEIKVSMAVWLLIINFPYANCYIYITNNATLKSWANWPYWVLNRPKEQGSIQLSCNLPEEPGIV